MALWGNKDNKTGSGTISIVGATGVVTGSATPAFDTELKIGNTITVSGEDYNITKIASASSMTVAPGVRGATMTDRSSITTGNWYVSEKPAYVAEAECADTSGTSGNSTKVYGVDTTERAVGGDNVTSVAVGSAGARYIATDNSSTAPTVAIAAPASLTIPVGAVSSTNDTITLVNHNFATGTKLTYANGGGANIAGLSNSTAYYVIKIDDDTFKLASSYANATNATPTVIDLTGATGNALQTFTGDTATATAAIASNVISAITVSAAGSGYRQVAPTATITKPRRTIATSAITTGTDTIAYTGHLLVAGDAVAYNNGGSTSATGLTSGTTYYVANAGLTANAFEVKAANTTGTLAATVAVSGTAGQFTCGNSTLAAGDRVTITGTLGGTATITSYATGTTYKVSAVTGTSPSVTGFTLQTEAGGALTTAAGTLTGLTYTTETVIDITATGNNAQYFELQGTSDAATVATSLGAGSGTFGPAHAGWVRRTVGTGGRAGRVFYEVLVASGSINADAPDDLVFPDA